MFERFTDRARRVTVLAQEEARLLGHDWIGVEHFLLGFVHEEHGIAAKALHGLGITDIEQIREEVELESPKEGKSPSGHIPFTPAAKKMLEMSLREALQLGHNYIGTEHMLLALAKVISQDLTTSTGSVLLRLGITPHDIRKAVLDQLNQRPEFRSTPVPAPSTVLERNPEHAPIVVGKPQPASKTWVTVERDQLIEACDEYLGGLHCGIWGRAFDLFQKDSRREASEFVADLVLDIVKHLESRDD